MSIHFERTRECLKQFDFQRLFVEELGWSRPARKVALELKVKESQFKCRHVAELAGAVVCQVESDDGAIPDARTRAAVHKEIAKFHHENLLIFVDRERTQSLWYWVKRQNGIPHSRDHLFCRGQPGDLFLGKLSQMVFDLADFDAEGNVSIVDVAQRLKSALDVERVTKEFFRQFQDQHAALLELIHGISDERQRRWYVSVLLNRLMFIYFLQKKPPGFLDGGNQHYLRDKLEQSKQRGKDRFHSEFLQALFFEGFAKPEESRSAATKKLLGQVAYLNGGLFLPHQIEQQNPNIAVSDHFFENLFSWFDRYTWHLDDTPGGKDDEINPDVLGYIFEKYINQKAFGAYYTRTEITEYLCERTIHRLILDAVTSSNSATARGYDALGDLLLNLDAAICRQLLHQVLPGLSLLDPACGSGAFLVAAMKTLINVYGAVVGRIKFLKDGQLTSWLAEVERNHPNVGYFIKKRIITDNLFGVDIMDEATEIAKLRLFLALVASAETVEHLEPLPNIDFNIMAGNSLMGLIHVDEARFEQPEPSGSKSKQKSFLGGQIASEYREVLADKNRSIELYREHAFKPCEDETGAQSDRLLMLREAIETVRRESYQKLNWILLGDFAELGIKYEEATWDDAKGKAGKPKKRPLTCKDIEALHPFHWGFEFDEIIGNRGGFDAIITNPPWEVFETSKQEFLKTHRPHLMNADVARSEWDRLFDCEMKKSAELRSAWCRYSSSFPHASAYFKESAAFPGQRVTDDEGRRVPSKLNLYRLFLERSVYLLRVDGEAGVVIPTTIWTGRGARELRNVLFNDTSITGAFGFRNTLSIFENVGTQEEFVVLTLRKSGSGTKSFPVVFMRERVEDLSDFPHRIGFTLPIERIRKLFPRSIRVPEFESRMDVTIMQKLANHPGLNDGTNESWCVPLCQEFNMTTSKSLFHTHPGAKRLPLIQGASFGQFQYSPESIKFWIDEAEGRGKLVRVQADDRATLPYEQYRLVHQRIARKNQSRSLVATVIPRNCFCADTAHTPKLTLPERSTLYLVALLNSFVCDFQIRLVITSHLDKHFMDELRLPPRSDFDRRDRLIVERAAKLICTSQEFDDLAKQVGLNSHKQGVTDAAKRAVLRAELDGLIAHLYGLTEAEFAHVLSTFPLVPDPVKVATQNAYRDVERGLLQ